MDLAALQGIKRWQVGHRTTHPVEYHAWDCTLVLWLVGWIGLLPAFAFGTWWTLGACFLGMALPDLYVASRAWLHRRGRVRCDWLVAVPGLLPRRPHVRR